jgi:hypothetical protein
MMFVCMALMRRHDGPAEPTGSDEVVALRAELDQLRSEQAQPPAAADDDGDAR